MPILHCEARSFSNRFGINGTRRLSISWPQIVHAAITVGRSGWRDVFRHGRHSLFEMFYRYCMIYANLQTSYSNHIIKSRAYKSLDPSEKSAISYFLGLTFTKLMATRLFGIPWLMHLDVYKNHLSILTGGRRPDLVGQDSWGRWSVFEAKGRTSRKEPGVVATAKAQTRGLSPDYSWNMLIRASNPAFSCGRSPVSLEPLSIRLNRLENRTIEPVINRLTAKGAVTRRQVDFPVRNPHRFGPFHGPDASSVHYPGAQDTRASLCHNRFQSVAP